ncbi:MAG: MmcB family DNA repair protein [Pyrinomonadaceae bacterium]
MNSKEVLGSLCGLTSNCLWSPLRLVAVPNTTTIAGWEADLLLLHPSGWVWEVEIKVSVSDFRREFRTKSHKHKALENGSIVLFRGPRSYPLTIKNRYVQKFFFAVPYDVYEKLKPEDFPDYAGIIVINSEKVGTYERPIATVVRRAKNLPGVEKTGSTFRIRLLELAHGRLWSRGSISE